MLAPESPMLALEFLQMRESRKEKEERRNANENEDNISDEAANSILDVIVEELVAMRSSEELAAEQGDFPGYNKPGRSGGNGNANGKSRGPRPGGKPGNGPPRKRKKKQVSA